MSFPQGEPLSSSSSGIYSSLANESRGRRPCVKKRNRRQISIGRAEAARSTLDSSSFRQPRLERHNSLLIGYFEGIGAERGIAWRLADSLALRRFVGIGLDESAPDHSTISRTRRLIDVGTHRAVFSWVLGVLANRGLLKGQRIVIDATTLEANAAMRSIVRRDTGRVTRSFCADWRRPRASKR